MNDGSPLGCQVSLEELPLRESLRHRSPYGAPQLDFPIRLNTNENPYPPSELVCQQISEAISQRCAELNRYPDREATELREHLAHYIHTYIHQPVTRENVWAANGSNEILLQLLQAFGGPGRCALGFSPSYSMHPIIASSTDTTWRQVERTTDFRIDVPASVEAIERDHPDIIFITSPNNPTGGVIDHHDLVCLLEHAPGIVIVDEAYGEFSCAPSAIELLESYPHKLVVVRTMSKAFGFAGARLGYLIAAPAFCQALLRVRLPYHLSSLTQIAGCVALEHAHHTLRAVQTLIDQRTYVESHLSHLGFDVIPSQANFLLFGRFRDHSQAWNRYGEEGILIRDVNIEQYLRVTIGTPQENDAFLAASARLAQNELLTLPRS